MITRRQLLALGFTSDEINHRRVSGRLHPVHAGVFAVGRPELSAYGRWMAAVLSCGPGAAASHETAGQVWEIRSRSSGLIEVSVPEPRAPRRLGLKIHRRASLNAEHVTRFRGIPVTSVVCTIVDLAVRLGRDGLEATIGEADKRGLTNPEQLRASLDAYAGWHGVANLRRTLDRRTFVLTHTKLERLFLPIVREVGLPLPATQHWVNGGRVDFFWPELGLVVETDGLSYHRTPAQQAKDYKRDQEHLASGLTPLRFSHEEVKFEPDHVRVNLDEVAKRLGRR